LGDVLKLEPGMLYHHLKKLGRTGWVTVDVEPQGTRPPRQVYTLTEDGKTELLRWLREPVTHTRDIRLDFLVKLYFGRLLDPALAADLVRGQLEKSREMESVLESRLAESASPANDFGRQVLDLRLLQTRAAITWLESL
jgi:DNA-binding PadR family transcriptional regulator